MACTTSGHRKWRPIAAFAALAIIACATISGSGIAQAAQPSFASPQQAFDKLVAAIRDGDAAGLIKILGPESKSIVGSGDPVADKKVREKFIEEYTAANKIVQKGEDRAVLVIGKDEWPFPIPAVKKGAAWHFDTKAGKEEILNRRIGANELSTIDVCLAYVDAQRDYATKDRNNDGVLEYAQKFASSPGKHDGLFWPAASGEEQSPMGPLIVGAKNEGYTAKQGQRTPYHGYYFKILKAQGPSASGGAMNYVVKGRMIGGFALVAFPARYGNSGIMTFIVNYDDVVYQKNLGPNTAGIAERMTLFDPGEGWTKAPQ